MFVAQSEDIDARHIFPGCQSKPDKDSNGLITTIPVITMLISPVGTLISAHTLSTVGKRDMILVTWKVSKLITIVLDI